MGVGFGPSSLPNFGGLPKSLEALHDAQDNRLEKDQPWKVKGDNFAEILLRQNIVIPVK